MALAFPLSVDPGGTVMSPGVDTNLFLWTLAWNAHAVARNPFAIFHANTFHPFANTLAFSENLIGSSIIAAPILWLGGGPVLAMNVVAVVSVLLSAVGAYVLGRELGVSRAAAFVGGVAFGFAPPRFFRLDQLHLTTVQWVPFCLAFAHAYLKRGRRRDLRVAAAFFTVQALSSGHAAVFLATALIMLGCYEWASGTPLQALRRARDFGVVGVILTAPAFLVLLPYRRVQDEVDILRTLADYRVVGWESFLASPSHVHRWIADTVLPGANIIGRAGAYLFPGVLPLLLAAVALAPRYGRPADASGSRGGTWSVRPVAAFLELFIAGALVVAVWATFSAPVRWRVGDATLMTIRSATRAWLLLAVCVTARVALLRRAPLDPFGIVRTASAAVHRWRDRARGNFTIFYGLLTALCVWISVAPPYSLWPHVYWLPGLSFIRAPSRFMILGMLGIAVLSAIGFDRASRNLTRRARAFATTAVVLIMIGEFAAAPLGVTVETAAVPAIDRWLAGATGPRVIAEAPVIEAVSEHDLTQSQYMLHSTAHWHKTVHGYSGVHPPLTDGLYDHLSRFPSDETIRALKSVGVNTVVVHLDAYPPKIRPDIERQLTDQSALRLEHVEGDGRVYAIP